MSESREYYTRGGECGSLYISEEVLEAIAGAAAMDVEGVTGLSAGSVGEQLLGKKKLSKGVTLQWEDDTVTATVSIQIAHGSVIPEVSRKVQEAVISGLEATSGLHVSAVNVRVSGITFAKTEE